MTTKALPCPKCGSEVTITPSYGGRGTGGMTGYIADCKCGLSVDHLGMGTMRSAVSAWNTYAKEQRSDGDQDRQ